MHKPKVMVIDDCEITLSSTKMHLEETGFEVITRADVIGTTSAVLNEKPNCVLMDVSMPAFQGTDLVKLIKKKEKEHIKIILYSAKDKEELKLLVDECGDDGYISKTDDISKLSGKVRLIIESQSAYERGQA
jgi:DNA-binding response OmpR family regulator